MNKPRIWVRRNHSGDGIDRFNIQRSPTMTGWLHVNANERLTQDSTWFGGGYGVRVLELMVAQNRAEELTFCRFRREMKARGVWKEWMAS